MKLTVGDAGEVKIVRIEGELDTLTSRDAEAQLTQLIDAGARKVVVNFERLVYISSVGLSMLLAAAKQLQVSGGELRVCSLSDVVQEVFHISGFDSILSVSKNEAEALKGF
jgi:anti-sigma B factor antagonist